MSVKSQFDGIVRARSCSSEALLASLKQLDVNFTEIDLANTWYSELKQDDRLVSFGWYQPPPHGVSVLIGNPSDYKRLEYQSLRSPENFPDKNVTFQEESILYPYYSAIDKQTLMIGDHVATYYNGNNKNTIDWMQNVYELTENIAKSVQVGMNFSEIYDIATQKFFSIGARNNTYSLSGGLASDIGHTIPFFGEEVPRNLMDNRDSNHERIIESISGKRKFVRKDSRIYIENNIAFTLEPQVIVDGYPMASFHMIVAFVDGDKFIIRKFRKLFEYFGMDSWLKSSIDQSSLS